MTDRTAARVDVGALPTFRPSTVAGRVQVAGRAVTPSPGPAVKDPTFRTAPRAAWRRRFARIAGLLASPLLLLAIWELLGRTGVFPHEVLVPPDEVAASFVELIQSGELQDHLGSSLGRLFIGYALGAGIGLALGSLMGLSKSVEAYLQPAFQLLRQLPTIALIPAFIMLFGIGETVKIVLVAKATALPVALATFEGVRGVARVHFDVARIYRVRGLQLFTKVVFPATVPPVLTGMRIALSRSWMVLVGAELLVSDNGLGQMMEWGRQMFRIDIVLVGVILTGVLGFAFDRGFTLAERRLVRWKYR